MLELLNLKRFVLKDIENVLMLHKLFFYLVLGVAAVADLDACDETLTVEFRKGDGYGVTTIYEEDDTDLVTLVAAGGFLMRH